ncbi:hypothetical protein BLOT_001537 [Blomia tropicalis]|nr:hypothetical protein BLOT_001537 [Blomia tropicalis]
MRSNRRAGIIQTFHVIQTDTKNFPTKGFFPTNHFEDVKLSIISMSIHRMCLILCLARIKIEAVKNCIIITTNLTLSLNLYIND